MIKSINKTNVWAFLICLFSITTLKAQMLDEFGIESVKLDDGTTVTLFRGLSQELVSMDSAGKVKEKPKVNDYYYLPTNLRLGVKPNGVPEFLFTKFTTESKTGVSGAIMHFLMEFGLTQIQVAELQEKLREKTGNKQAVVKSQVQLQPDEVGGSFQIISATLSDKGFATSVLNGRAPLLEGGKVAVATRLTPDGAMLLSSTFEKAKSISDLSISLNYKYTTIIPAFKAKMVYDWSRLKEMTDSSSSTDIKDNKKVGWFGWSVGNSKTTKEDFRKLTENLMEKKIVYLDMMETGISPEKTAIIRQAFLDMFIKEFTIAGETPAMSDPGNTGPKEQGGAEKALGALSDATKMIKWGKDEVTVKNTFKQKVMQGKREEINFSYSLPVVKDVSITGNLASWYQGVRDNKNCVNSVNLNDPFFQHRDINFIMDLEAKEMFEKEINYVTVNVRKKRSVGNSFEDRLTMDLKYFNEKGINATMTYARGEDKEPDAYEYQTQWSTRGGNIYPTTPVWEKGQWEGVTLLPPLTPRTIEFEAAIEDLKAANLSRAVLQVRYSKFGQEVEENIPISVAKNEGIISKQLFMDRNSKGYAYRIVYNHKESGKLATEFSSKINDYYVYATIPDGFKDKNSDTFKKSLDLAKSIAQPSSDGKVTTGKVLDMFQDIFGKTIDKTIERAIQK